MHVADAKAIGNLSLQSRWPARPYDTQVWAPCEGYQPLYNPGGGGNVYNDDPYMGLYVAGSLPVSWPVDVDLDNANFVSYDSGASRAPILTLTLVWVAFAAITAFAIYALHKKDS